MKRTTQKELEAPNGLFKNWLHWKKYPYKNVIEKHVRKISQEKRMFSKGIENLCSTKYLVNEPNYGFDSYPNIAGSINKYFGK